MLVIPDVAGHQAFTAPSQAVVRYRLDRAPVTALRGLTPGCSAITFVIFTAVHVCGSNATGPRRAFLPLDLIVQEKLGAEPCCKR